MDLPCCAAVWYAVMKGTELGGVLSVMRYVSLIKEGVGVSDLLFRDQYVVVMMYVYE
jgi:hypothetical protein